jgi:hypothetical protein
MSSDEVAFASEAAPAHHSIHVLIPSHSYTLTISTLTADATVSDLKAAISEQCPGRPSISGQRVIVQGRVLKEEEPIVEFLHQLVLVLCAQSIIIAGWLRDRSSRCASCCLDRYSSSLSPKTWRRSSCCFHAFDPYGSTR